MLTVMEAIETRGRHGAFVAMRGDSISGGPLARDPRASAGLWTLDGGRAARTLGGRRRHLSVAGHTWRDGLRNGPPRVVPRAVEDSDMTPIREAADDFLAHRRIGVTGVSRNPAGHGANVVYKRLRERGYEVFAVNPNAETVEGDRCWTDLKSIPGGVDGVVIGTRPEIADVAMRECVELCIRDVWMHRSFGEGSVSDQATAYGREHGLRVIDGGCPLMFEPCSDGAHRFMRPVLTWTGKVPKAV